MKKKIVNAVLSVAVVTSMLFAVTACGSKDDAGSTSANAPAEESTVVPEETSTVAEEASIAQQKESGAISLEDWLNAEENASQIDAILASLSSDEMSLAFEADGDAFVMKYTFNDMVELGDEDKELMKQEFEAQPAVFESMRDSLSEETGNPNVKVRIVYVNGDGSEIFTYEF